MRGVEICKEVKWVPIRHGIIITNIIQKQNSTFVDSNVIGNHRKASNQSQNSIGVTICLRYLQSAE